MYNFFNITTHCPHIKAGVFFILSLNVELHGPPLFSASHRYDKKEHFVFFGCGVKRYGKQQQPDVPRKDHLSCLYNKMR